MEFPGPDTADLAQVESLNRAFLEHLGREGRSLASRLPPGIAAALVQAGGIARDRLAKCPFLLFSLREADEQAWSDVFNGGTEPDLVDALARPTVAESRIVSAALAFLWPFACRNPYAARVVSGAPVHWCERLAESRLLDLIEFASNRGGLLSLRFADNGNFWRRMAFAGTSDETAVRQAARITALQDLLTRPPGPGPLKLPAAACRMPAPALQVAERSAVSRNRARRYNTPPHDGPVDPTTRKDLPKR